MRRWGLPCRSGMIVQDPMFRSFSFRCFCSALLLPLPTFDVSRPKGIDLRWRIRPRRKKYLIETMPGGVCPLRLHDDGLLDIFL